jgi:hypothetical protein
MLLLLLVNLQRPDANEQPASERVRVDSKTRKSHPSGPTQTDSRGQTDAFPAQMWEPTGSARTSVRSVHTSWRALWCPPLAHMSLTAATGHLPPGMQPVCEPAPPRPRRARRQLGIDAMRVAACAGASMPRRFGARVALLSPARCTIARHHPWQRRRAPNSSHHDRRALAIQ